MGNISCQAQENNQLEIKKDIKPNLELNEKKSKAETLKKPSKINKSKTRIISHKILNKKQLKNKNFNIKKIINPKRKSNTKEKSPPKFHKEIKNIIPADKNRNTKSQKNNIKPNFNKNFPKFQKRKSLNKNQQKIKEIKIHTINYNDISNNLSNEFNEDELIIDNNNDELDESIQIFGFEANNNEKNCENKLLKEKINKTKEKIINIKNEMDSKNLIKKNISIERNKISNTIYINNSNVTINNNKNNIIESNNLRRDNSSITPKTLNYFNSNIQSIEYNEVVDNKIKNNDINKEKNKLYYTDTNIISKTIKKKHFNHRYNIEQKSNTIKYNKDEKIINKIKEINCRITNKMTPQKRKTYPVFDSRIKKSETMDNKQIRKNIPSYRRDHSKSNNICQSTLNSCTFDKNKIKRSNNLQNLISLENSFNINLCNSNIKTKTINKNDFNPNLYSFKKRKHSTNKNSKDIKTSFLSNSSVNNLSNEGTMKDNKTMKNQRLFNIISKNILKREEDNQNSINDIDINNNIDKILFYKFRDATEIDISPLNMDETLIDKELLKSHVNDKIILNYSKLDNFSTSQILYDGIIYKIIENKNRGFKITERYFQIKKNSFRYYNDIEKAKNDSENPLVQFDIRHIKELNIIDSKVFKQFKINEKEIEFTFYICLNQNEDFFVFVVNDEKLGNSIFNFLNLLKNYYEDKKQ